MNEIQQLLLSDMPLWISSSGYIQLMISAFPMVKMDALPIDKAKLPNSSQFFFLEEKTYQEETREQLDRIKAMLKQEASTKTVNVTCDYSSAELPDGSIAYHRVFGFITANSTYRFSSKQLEADMMAADANPQITCHFLHVNSPGGEAWYLDRLGETMQNCEKPIVVLYENCCSAAYHIACHGTKVYANTKFDFVGCIGTMTSFWDFEEYYAKLGIKKVEAKATKSDLKNKMFDDLVDGKPKQFVENVLNPLNEEFISTVRSQRTQLAKLEDGHPALRGETYYTDDAVEIGLADGCRTLAEAVAEAATLGHLHSETKKAKDFVYNAI